MPGKIESPRLEFWALRIDLDVENLKIVTGSSGAGINTANSGNTLSRRVSSFVRENNLIAGINAVPFDIVSAREGEPIRNLGIIISNGERLSPINPYYDALVIYAAQRQSSDQAAYPYRRAAIVRQSSIQSAENIENAIGGFFQILTGGVPAQRTLTNDARHPRSAAGVSDNGRYLYLLAVDGRRAGSIGSTERETAILLYKLGSRDGINFDGGGSTALAMRFTDGNIRTVNTPIHIFPGQERAVAGCIGIRVD
ncbi:MAG: phosphodiester glycosidase family protein [Treponema sp.]|nr:phosphodiester glycosidase family protein [Treponema sp.]